MNAITARDAIDLNTYDIRHDNHCGCSIAWNIARGELTCDITPDECYSANVLVIAGEDVATYISNHCITDYEIEDYTDDYGGDDDDQSLLDDVTALIELNEDSNGVAHDDNIASSLTDYIESLIADGWRLYRDNERGFGNEYTCVLVAPDADPDILDDDWDILDVETWVSEYLYSGDAATTAYNGIKIIE